MGSGRRGRATATAIAALGVVFQGAGASMDCLQEVCCVNCFVWCCFHSGLVSCKSVQGKILHQAVKNLGATPPLSL